MRSQERKKLQAQEEDLKKERETLEREKKLEEEIRIQERKKLQAQEEDLKKEREKLEREKKLEEEMRSQELKKLQAQEEDLKKEREKLESESDLNFCRSTDSIEDIVSSASMARGAKRLTVSLGASCLLDFSALRLAGTSISAAPWGL
ncbi:hypothetical protein PoB_006372100 [Plakobranchus ocellatus]|uniref:Uncharacterized protein n=1 Tax=Plakobranchus ocellatus TaxID=259542 RepID=A0AAV4CZQ4_9GAST|nr:hypothetical protein PoB_006372100 [Plakobranchus ocellatus]